jgi:cytoskeletal protein CcmA (bactofilin family)
MRSMRAPALPFLAFAGCLLIGASASADSSDEGHWFGSHYVAASDEVSVRAPVLGDALLAGGHVRIDSPVNGDLSLAAGEVEVEAAVNGAARIAAGTVAVRAPVGGALWVTGGDLSVDSVVGGKSWLAGGNVRTGSGAVLPGPTTISAGEAVLDGRYAGALTIRAGHVELRGDFLGDVEVQADQLLLAPGARIAGKLRYYTPEPLPDAAAAQVAGGAEHHPRGHDMRFGFSHRPGYFFGGWGSVVGLWLVGALLLLVAPDFVTRVHRGLATDPWTSLGTGILALIAVPCAASILIVTIIGIPFGILLLVAYGFALAGGYVLAASFLAAQFLARVTPGATPGTGARLLALSGVLLLLALVHRIYAMGTLVHAFVLLFGLGAGARALFHRDTDTGAAPSPAAA